MGLRFAVRMCPVSQERGAVMCSQARRRKPCVAPPTRKCVSVGDVTISGPVDPAVPPLLYGTAWKGDATEALVHMALTAGFRGLDTANQRKHYHEAGVGRGLAAAITDGVVTRADVFVQTKFTFVDGQDDRLPYDRAAPVATQVAQSCARSLEHLGVDRLDSLILHGPSQSVGLGAADREAWRAMEALVDDGRVARLGVSNVSAAQVTALVGFARIAPRFVQNRCYAQRGWDRGVRELCARHQIVYQGFSLLTANRHVLVHRGVVAIAARHRRTPAEVVLRFAQQVGMLPLTGTLDRVHMLADLSIDAFRLGDDELAVIDGAGA
jgi:diketogulonate reductase-like aldo/keto reductase